MFDDITSIDWCAKYKELEQKSDELCELFEEKKVEISILKDMHNRSYNDAKILSKVIKEIEDQKLLTKEKLNELEETAKQWFLDQTVLGEEEKDGN